jgi:hypothetical protein
LLFGASLVAASALVLSGPVRALEQEGITVGKGQTTSKEYGPIPATNPALAEDPESCKLDPWCAYIPLTIDYGPGFDPEGDDFTVVVEMSWDAVNLEASYSNDLDMYIYELPFDPEADPPQEPVGQGASAGNPEKANLFRPTAGTYAILVNNFLGPNSGFTISATYADYPIPPVFESLEPPVQNQNSGSTGEAADRPAPTGVDLGFGFGSDLTPVDPGAVGGPVADQAYAFTAPPGASQLPEVQEVGTTPRRTTTEPVSGWTVALWLGGSALAMGAIAVWWFRRHRPAALRYA